ncbi:thioredoxin family protein [Thermocrinis sp.]|uniref:thioredoxin family protein n=1 Tax=Thermocrinis sp. TaxID=2024383 RepID=UPI002FDD27A0
MESVLKFLFFVVAFVVFLRLGLKLYVLKKAKTKEGMMVESLSDGVLYFYSQRCGACKAMEPHIEALAKELEVKKLDVFSEEGQNQAKKFGVMATPTTVLVKNGKVHKVFVGIVSADKILKEFKL